MLDKRTACPEHGDMEATTTPKERTMQTVGTPHAPRFNFVTGEWMTPPAPLTAGERVWLNNCKLGTLVCVTDTVSRFGAHAWDRWDVRLDNGATVSVTSLFLARV